ncbi:MAG: hypothetical protein V3U34_00470 [candidate division NC10 bacterium]
MPGTALGTDLCPGFIDNMKTSETDTGLRLAPDGSGGVEFAATGGTVSSVASGDADIILVAPTTGAVVVTATNQEIDTTDGNTAYGEGAGNVGVHAGAVDNTSLGRSALAALTAGDNNTGLGEDALAALTSGVQNTAVGSKALAAQSTTTRGVAVGAQSLLNANANDLTGLGYRAGASVSSGAQNTFGGANSGADGATPLTAADNTAFGFNAGNALEGALAIGNTLLGSGCGGLMQSGEGNVAAGENSLAVCVSGSKNVAIGQDAMSLYVGTGATNCTAVGDNAMRQATTGMRNVALGDDCMSGQAVSGNDNVGVGSNCLNQLSSGVQNVAIGRVALDAVQTGNNSTAIGIGALSAFTGSEGTSVGALSLFNATTGVNTAVGYNALNDVVTAGGNAAFGHSAGALCTGQQNTFLGALAGDASVAADGCIVIGYNQDTSAAAADNELNIGGTIFGDLSSEKMVRIGGSGAITGDAQLELANTDKAFLPNRLTTTQRDALTAADGMVIYNTTDESHQFYQNGGWTHVLAGTAGGGALASTFIGNAAAGNPSVVTGGNNTAIGFDSAIALTSGITNMAVGQGTLKACTTGAGNAAIGNGSLLRVVGGSNNTGIGASSAQGLTSGSDNTVIGVGAVNQNLSTCSSNTIIGGRACNGVPLTGDDNTIVGGSTGNALSSGTLNLILGFDCADTLTTGARNILVGQNVEPSSATVDDELNIGDTIFGDLANAKVRIGGSGAVAGNGALQVESTNADTAESVRINQSGTNGAQTNVFVGTQDPSGTITADPGSLYVRVSGVNSSLSVNTGAAAGTTWATLS